MQVYEKQKNSLTFSWGGHLKISMFILATTYDKYTANIPIGDDQTSYRVTCFLHNLIEYQKIGLLVVCQPWNRLTGWTIPFLSNSLHRCELSPCYCWNGISSPFQETTFLNARWLSNHVQPQERFSVFVLHHLRVCFSACSRFIMWTPISPLASHWPATAALSPALHT